MAAKGTSAASGSMAGAIENYIIKIPLHRAGRLTSKAPSPQSAILYLPQWGKSVSLCQSISLLHSCPSYSHSPSTSHSFLTSPMPQLLLPFKNFKWKTLSASCSFVCVCGCVTDAAHWLQFYYSVLWLIQTCSAMHSLQLNGVSNCWRIQQGIWLKPSSEMLFK